MSQQSHPIQCLTFALAGTVGANLFVKPAGTLTGAGENALGVTRTAGVSGDNVPVDVLGTTQVLSGAAVAKGDTLKADAAGKAITWATSGAKLGIALQAAAGADQFIEVFLIPNVA